MTTIKNEKRKVLSVILAFIVLFTCIFSYPITESHAITVEKLVTKYHLDIGVQQIWGTEDKSGNVIWDNGIGHGGDMNVTTTIPFPQEIYNVKVYPYSASKFQWGDANYSSNVGTEEYYKNNYKQYASTIIDVTTPTPTTKGNTVTFSHIAKMSSPLQYDVAMRLRRLQINDIFRLMAGPEPADPEAAVAHNFPELYSKLNEGRNGVDSKVHAYMYFTPVIIQYDVKEMVEIGDFEPDITLPATAKQGETFTVADASNIDDKTTVEDAVLERRFNGGAWEHIITWRGTGAPGENTGESIDQIGNEIGTIEYRITVRVTTGEEKSKIKSISIIDGREAKGVAILDLPEYTYEGHPALAKDESTFEVNEESYSALRMYNENLADNSFSIVESNAGSIKELDWPTYAEAVFEKRGNYHVRLDVDLNIGSRMRLTDTKPIEVRKTPYIIDNLGGVQKQNRKQILNISVATYPGKPITDWYLILKDKETGQSVRLTPDNLKENNVNIKMRTCKVDNSDKCFTYFTLEFLTKTPRYDVNNPDKTQDFQYTIWVKDSKSDTDSVTKDFSVRPDKPPQANILMQDSFLRNKESNTAEITVEDISSTDGDQLQRTWSAANRNALNDAQGIYKKAEQIEGFTDLSFGIMQKIQFNKEGVGKTGVKLSIKDIWIEETLEEYITEEDYLTAAAIKSTEVVNIAPVVSLDPLRFLKANVAILALNENKAEIAEKTNSLRAALLEKGIDSNISVIPVGPSFDGEYTPKMAYTYKISNGCPCCQYNSIPIDSEYAFIVKSAGVYVSGNYDYCTSPHTIYALSEGNTDTSPNTVWSYTVRESNSFEISEDSSERYILIHCRDINKTIVLNRNNGAYLTTVNMLLPKSPYLSLDGQRMYFINSNKITRYDAQNGSYITLFNYGGYIPRIQNGKLTFVAKENGSMYKYYIAQLDMDKEQIERISLPVLDPMEAGTPVDMDSSGKVVFMQKILRENRYVCAYRSWYADSRSNTMSSASGGSYRLGAASAGLVKDEEGKSVAYYRFHITRGQAQNSDNYSALYISKIKEDGTLEPERCIYSNVVNNNGTGIIYAKYHTKENAIYIIQGGYFEGGESIGCTRGFKISLPSWSYTNCRLPGWDDVEEIAGDKGTLASTCYIKTGVSGGENRVKLFRYNIGKEQSEIKAMMEKASAKEDAKNYLVSINSTGSSTGEELTEGLNKFAEKFALNEISAKLQSLITDITQKIETTIKEENTMLHIVGDKDNVGKVENSMVLQANSRYEYDYDVITSGKAIDLISLETEPEILNEGEQNYYKEVIDSVDFTQIVKEQPYTPTFINCGQYITGYTQGLSYFKGCSRSRYTGLCAGCSNDSEKKFSCSFSFTLQNPGYVEFDYYGLYNTYGGGNVDGNEFYKNSMWRNDGGHRIAYLPAGRHTVTLNTGYYYVAGFTKATIGYIYDNDDKLKTTATANGYKVKGSFQGPKGNGYIKKKIIEVQGVDDIWKYIELHGGPNITKYSDGFSYSSSYNSGIGVAVTITAPSNKMLIMTQNEDIYNADLRYNISRGGAIDIGGGMYLIQPGGRYTLSINRTSISKYGGSSLYVRGLKLGLISYGLNGLTTSTKYLSGDNCRASCGTLNKGQPDFVEVKTDGNKFIFSKVSQIGKESFAKNVKISLSNSNIDSAVDQYISNFKLYKVSGNLRQLLNKENFFSQRIMDENWKTYITGNGIAQIEKAPIIEKDEDTPLIYKKGELVKYNINYSDYEADPKKPEEGYWIYAHTPYNDGKHPDAAIIYDADGNITEICGKAVTDSGITLNEAIRIAKKDGSKTLKSSIDRFYVDGKYTVYHWQYDDTSRGQVTGGYPIYDKSSNTAEVPFYIEGGASAPWITHISTEPQTIKEKEDYKIKVGVDDAEKDILNLTTEVYKEKKLIYTNRQKNITAAYGIYPYIYTDILKDAEAGRYDVVCTVRDQTGAGLGSYKYTVLSDGKITGDVYHTEQWDVNRKKFNLSWFKDEINREYTMSEYLASGSGKMVNSGSNEKPRKRGTNVFWSGERFMLQAAVAGSPTSVNCKIKGYSYSTTMKNTGKKNKEGEAIYQGSIWDNSMINKWGKKEPEQLTFEFTANYAGGTKKTHEVKVIVDDINQYWRLHRVF